METFVFFSFLDTTHVKTCRPGAGPVDATDGDRREGAWNIQRAFCSTYLKCNGLKCQTVMLPNGMWGSIYIASVRHNDLGMVNLSALPDLLLQHFVNHNITIGNGGYPSMYGDAIYNNTLVITRKIENAVEGTFEWYLNKRLNSARQCIEHGYLDLFGELFSC